MDGAPDPFGGVWVVARRPLMRLRGLAGRSPDRTTLVLPRCRDVHTFTMRQGIDIAFLDRNGVVMAVHRMVLPKTRLRHPKAATVVERFARPGPWLVRGDVCLFGSVSRKGFQRERSGTDETMPRLRKRAVR